MIKDAVYTRNDVGGMVTDWCKDTNKLYRKNVVEYVDHEDFIYINVYTSNGWECIRVCGYDDYMTKEDCNWVLSRVSVAFNNEYEHMLFKSGIE